MAATPSASRPEELNINGKSALGKAVKPTWTVVAGKTQGFRVCNSGLRTSVNFRFQNHSMKLVKLEGSHIIQNIHGSMDLHVGQCSSVLVTSEQVHK